MADEIRGNESVNASPDAASVFYLLKIRRFEKKVIKKLNS